MSISKIQLSKQVTVDDNIAFNAKRITGLGDPTSAQDAATKYYVDSLSQGLSPKQAVRVASTGSNISVAGPPTIIDGVTLADGDRVLLKDQTLPESNGIYVYQTLFPLVRADDFNAWSEIPSAFTFVQEGDTHADSGWVCTSNAGGTLNTTAITWVQFSGAGQITAGAGLTKTGNTIDVVTANAGRIVVNANSIDLASGIVTAGTYTKVTVDTYGRVTVGADVTLDDIGDVIVTSPQAGHSLMYNGATSNWVNQAMSLTDLSDVTITTPATGNVLRYDGGWSNAVLALEDLGDVALVGLQDSGQIIGHNGSNWTNRTLAVAGILSPTNFIIRETPTGTINGSNNTFTFLNTPIAGTEMVFLNGILLNAGVGNDYTISGATITLNGAIIPQTGETILVNYRKGL